MRAAPHIPRLAALDGLRGLAAVAVVIAHVTDTWTDLPWVPAGGQMGVLVFFVLSGYLIGNLVVRLDCRDDYAAFMRRRVVRLGPVVGVVAVVVPLGLWFDELPASEAFVQAVGVLTQSTGLSPLLGWRPHPVLVPTWSLTTEWIFYLVFPAIMIALSRVEAVQRNRTRMCLIAALGLYLVALPLDAALFYYLPVANLGVLLIGASVAFAHLDGWDAPALVTSGPAAYFSVGLLLMLTLLPGSAGSWNYRLSVMPATALAAAVLIHAMRHDHPVTRWFSWTPLAATGLRAYSLYLWHVPVMWAVWRLIGQHGSAWVLAAGLPIVVLVTIVSFRLLEAPVLPAARERSHGANAGESMSGY